MSYLNSERLTAIETRLARDGRVVATDLARDFATSEDTIRRDLRALAAAGRCRRVYGGALALATAVPLSARMTLAAPAKAALGAALASLVEPGMTVFLDVGTTNLACAEALARRADLASVTFITHAPIIAAALVEAPGAALVCVGGRIDPVVGAAIGAQALAEIDGLRPDLLLLGTCGLDPEAGLTAHSVEDAAVKRALATRATRVATACDAEKLGTAAPFPVIAVAACDILLLDAACPPDMRALLAGLGPRILDVELSA